MRWFLAILAISAGLLMSGPTQAQTSNAGKTIIVLDASGSMWGQVDGEPKISIARQALTDLLATLPPEQELGLVAYGHRRKGDCSDIQTLVEPGAGTRDAIRDAVKDINPKGKTPLSAAVIAAAEVLKYEEERATVILLSDGIETCDLDPCAVGSDLEAKGVDFTAHVIGFDVAADADREQLRCLAENTGGQFLSADNADELVDALETVSQTPPPPVLPEVIFQASEGEGGPIITEDLIWNLTDPESGDSLITNQPADSLVLELEPGRYEVDVLRTSDEAYATEEVQIAGSSPIVVTLVLVTPLPKASLDAPPSAPAGSTVAVGWSGPGGDRDYISVAKPGSESTAHVNYAYTRDGNPLELVMPADPGSYELRYYDQHFKQVLATLPIEATEVGASLEAPDSAPAGATIKVSWDGPDYQNDYISIAKVGDDDSVYINYSYTRAGSPLDLELPASPGAYELRYVQNQDRTVLARRPIEVTQIAATIAAPPSAKAGEELDVGWTGPDYRNDYISIAKLGDDDGKYVNYSYTREGSPLKLLMPVEPGDYEIRYVLNQDRTVLARHQISVGAVGATLEAPPTAAAGEELSVGWSGPDYRNDYISVAKLGDDDSKYINYSYTREGSPLKLLMPVEPGDYEIRYVVNQDRTVLARQQITVTAVGATLEAPPTAKAGETIKVAWSGPDYQRDFIAVSEVGAKDSSYVNYAYAREGSPLDLLMPAEPGDYEIRYVVNQDKTVLARQPIKVEAVGATLEVPPNAPAGATIEVTWSGPDYKSDFISIAEVGAKDSAYVNYSYTRQGKTLDLLMPALPGTYEVRYILSQGKTALARQTIEVTEVTATIEAPPSVTPGRLLSLAWTGPDYKSDFVCISKPGSKDGAYLAYVYTRNGSPAELRMPDQPGEYELRYVMNQDKRVLIRVPIIVE